MTEPMDLTPSIEAAAVLALVASTRDDASDLSDLALLHVGCGEGVHARQLAHSFRRVTALDSDFDKIMRLSQSADLANLKLACDDMRIMDISNGGPERKDPVLYDVVLCLAGAIGYMLTLEDLTLAVLSMTAHLVSSGVLILEPNLTHFGQEQFGEVLLDAGLDVTYNPSGLSPQSHGVYYGIKPAD